MNDNELVAMMQASIRIGELQKQLAAVTAERDALKAQLDAVPLNAIALYWEATYVDYGRLAPDDHMKVAKADEAFEDWIAKVRYETAPQIR